KLPGWHQIVAAQTRKPRHRPIALLAIDLPLLLTNRRPCWLTRFCLSDAATLSNPFLRTWHRGIRGPKRRALRMIARPDGNRIIIRIVLTRALEQLAERHDRGRRLVLELVDATGKRVGHLFDVARMDEGSKSERLFPEQVDHVLQIIDSLLTLHLVLLERILATIQFAVEVAPHDRGGKLC